MAVIVANREAWLRVTVIDRRTGAPLDLTGATYRALMGRRGAAGTEGTAETIDAPAGIVDVTFPAGAAVAPSVIFQLDVDFGDGMRPVVDEELAVRTSLA